MTRNSRATIKFGYILIMAPLFVSSCSNSYQPPSSNPVYMPRQEYQPIYTKEETDCTRYYPSYEISKKLEHLGPEQKNCPEASRKSLLDAVNDLKNADICAIKNDTETSHLYSQLRQTNTHEGFDRKLGTSGWFFVADKALSQGCLDIADDLYREILYERAPYIKNNPEYAADAEGMRDRAKLGIEDVREKRSRKK